MGRGSVRVVLPDRCHASDGEALRFGRSMQFNAGMRYRGQDALLGMLAPIWQVAILGCLLVTIVVAGYKLLMRGPSRMLRGVVVAGGAIVGVIILGVLFTMA
jgi:hypothetical protein